VTLPSAVSLVTLGVRDVQASAAFYERLGFERSPNAEPSIAFFSTAGTVLALFGEDALADDAGVPSDRGGSFRGVTLAINLPSREAVDEAYAHALDAGAAPLVAPEEVFWGGYRGYVADPDGHAWELCHNPFFPVDERGVVTLP
jgi:predicted lactoylglutathione lyase